MFYWSEDLSFSDYFAPGILIAIFHSIPMFFSSLMLLLERRDGHLERLFAANVKPTEVLLINTFMLFIAILLQVLFSMILAFNIYNIKLRGSYLDAFVLLVCQFLQGMSFGQFFSLCLKEEFSIVVCFGRKF